MKRHTFWDQKIPSYFVIVVLIIGIAVTGFLVQQGVLFQGFASPGNTPKDVTISNITDTTFSISYTTSDTVIGSLVITSENNSSEKSIVLDDKDKKNNLPKEYTTHHITVTNLRPQTAYTFSITSGKSTFTSTDGLPSFSITTGQSILQDTAQYQVKGKVHTASGKPATEGLLYLNTKDSQLVSTFIQPDGSYTLSFRSLRSKNLRTALPITAQTLLSLKAKNRTDETKAEIFLENAKSVPVLTFAKQYDFTSSETAENVTVSSSESAEIVDFPQQDNVNSTSQSKPVAIKNPKSEQRLSDKRPNFKGTSTPNTEVEITISGEEDIQANVIADRRGNWSYRPKTPLAPGSQTLTIKTQDEYGIAKTASQDFTILSDGSQFTEPSVAPNSPTPTKENSPTPSRVRATSTPTRMPTSRVTATPTRLPTTQPTPTGIPTMTPTRIPSITTPVILTITPSTIVTNIPITTSPQPSLPPTGNISGIMYGIIGAVTVGVGLLLFFLSSGGIPL